MSEYRFDAMGCEIVVGGAHTSERRAIEELFRSRELVFSRFIPGSELNQVNASAGRPVLVSPLFADTLRIALRAAKETCGLVDPTLGAALVAAGYTRDSTLLEADPRPPEPADGAQQVFTAGRVFAAPSGVQLDLNGVVKALAVDHAVALLSGEGFVSAGGDIAVRGALSVALPGGGAVELRRGALATSGTTKRRWLRGGQVQHHLLDPLTGRPASSPWSLVTACGATCVAADIAAKAGLLSGYDGSRWLDSRGIPARFVGVDGKILTNESWDRSMREELACI